LPPSAVRLDSWKAIAEYLRRDLATVRRWEKNLGMPVRRVAGAGRSVFAYSAEIDEWLQTARPGLPEPVPGPAAAAATTGSPRLAASRWLGLTAAILAVAGGVFARGRRVTVDDLRVELTAAGVIARNTSGVEQWRHPFPENSITVPRPGAVEVRGGAQPGVYFATSHRGRGAEDQVESGALTFLDLHGQPQRTFSFDDRVTFHGTAYGAPWVVTAFAVDDSGPSRRVAVSAHHYLWDPGLVTILDDRWQRHGTFVHAGWIEAVRWFAPDRLLIAGFSNAHDGGMIALLDASALDGQGPEPAGNRHFCETCGTDQPLRMFVFPRSEINQVTASPFNRVIVQTADRRLVAHTIEMPSTGGDVDAIYEFSASFDIASARFSERYWEIHRSLEADGRIIHRRDQCPDRDGPRAIQSWQPATGWKTIALH
jgi:hypothetical protein